MDIVCTPTKKTGNVEILYSEPFESSLLQAMLFCLLLAIVLTLNPIIAERSLPLVIDTAYLEALRREHIFWLEILALWILCCLETYTLLIDHTSSELVVVRRRLLYARRLRCPYQDIQFAEVVPQLTFFARGPAYGLRVHTRKGPMQLVNKTTRARAQAMLEEIEDFLGDPSSTEGPS